MRLEISGDPCCAELEKGLHISVGHWPILIQSPAHPCPKGTPTVLHGSMGEYFGMWARFPGFNFNSLEDFEVEFWFERQILSHRFNLASTPQDKSLSPLPPLTPAPTLLPDLGHGAPCVCMCMFNASVPLLDSEMRETKEKEQNSQSHIPKYAK